MSIAVITESTDESGAFIHALVNLNLQPTVLEKISDLEGLEGGLKKHDVVFVDSNLREKARSSPKIQKLLKERLNKGSFNALFGPLSDRPPTIAQTELYNAFLVVNDREEYSIRRSIQKFLANVLFFSSSPNFR